MSEYAPRAASEKALSLEDLFMALTGKHRPTVISQGGCMTCDAANVVLRDTQSAREYSISGMCQKCQDEMFGR